MPLAIKHGTAISRLNKIAGARADDLGIMVGVIASH